jgi:hypothetical protein
VAATRDRCSCVAVTDTVEPRQCRQADFSDWNLWFFLKIEYVLAS